MTVGPKNPNRSKTDRLGSKYRVGPMIFGTETPSDITISLQTNNDFKMNLYKKVRTRHVRHDSIKIRPEKKTRPTTDTKIATHVFMRKEVRRRKRECGFINLTISNPYERKKKKEGKKCGQTFADVGGYKRIVPNLYSE